MSSELPGVENAPPSIESRFETQTSVDTANAIREKEWKDAYARIGQEPPKREEVIDDGRTLYERLKTQKELKTEEWDNKMKLSNQYRGLDSEEMKFLSEKALERRAAERKRDELENAEVREYREAQAAKLAAAAAAEPAMSPTAAASTSTPKRMPVKAVKKDVRSLLKGVVVKKKPKSVEPAASHQETKTAIGIQSAPGVKRPGVDWEQVTVKKSRTEADPEADKKPGKDPS